MRTTRRRWLPAVEPRHLRCDQQTARDDRVGYAPAAIDPKSLFPPRGEGNRLQRRLSNEIDRLGKRSGLGL